MEQEKFRCKDCEIEKPLTPEYFYKNKKMKTGYLLYCKECKKKRKKEYRKRNKKELERKRVERIKRLEEKRENGLLVFDKTKRCYKCEKYFLRNKDNFKVAKSNTDGLSGVCKTCCARYDKLQHKRYYQENKNKILKYNKSWNKKAYKENPKRYKIYAKEMYWANPEKSKKNVALWRQKNREHWLKRSRIASQRRRARLSKLEHNLTLEEWQESLKYFDNSCAYCGAHQDDLDSSLEQDHVIPVSKGGAYKIDNIVPACKPCNTSKSTQDLIEWYKSKEYSSDARLEAIMLWIKESANA